MYTQLFDHRVDFSPKQRLFFATPTHPKDRPNHLHPLRFVSNPKSFNQVLNRYDTDRGMSFEK
jgi:hypothetical protein